MKTLILTIALSAALLAQPNQLDLRQDPPVAVQSERVSSAYTGTSGATTYYYWVVTRYPIGFIVPTSPVVVGGAAALGGGNSVALGWPAMTGASSYDVLRTTTNAAPSSCTCAVVLATTGTTLTDNGGALSAWPPGGLNSAGMAQAELQINNRDAGAPYITMAVRNAQRTLNYQLGILKNGAAPSYVPSGFIQPYSNAQGAMSCVGSTGADCNISIRATNPNLPSTELTGGQLNYAPDNANTNPAGRFLVYTEIGTFPTANSPTGNDLRVGSRASYDFYLLVTPLVLTSTTTVAAPGAETVNVGSTAKLAEIASITIEPGTANEETIQPADWSIASGTTITATFALAHTQPYVVQQQGAMALSSTEIRVQGDSTYIDENGVFHTQANRYPYSAFTDGNGSRYLFLPVNTAAAWPDAGIGVKAMITGANGTDNDLIFRNRTAASQIQVVKSDNSAYLYTLDDDGNVDFKGNATVQGYLLADTVQDAAYGADLNGWHIRDSSAERVVVGYSSTSQTGTKDVPAKMIWGAAHAAGDDAGTLIIAGRGNRPAPIVFMTSPDAGTTGLVDAWKVTKEQLWQSLHPYLVADLPTCNAGLANSFSVVTDATAPTYNGALTGGGAVRVPVFCDGSAWTSH